MSAWSLLIYAASPVPGGDIKAGLGDITQSFFFSPKTPTRGGWIWGIGLVSPYPSAAAHALGAEKFGLCPTAVALKQEHGWTYGMLFNHIWSVAGNASRDNVEYTIGVSGCGKRTTLVVICPDGAKGVLAPALAESTIGRRLCGSAAGPMKAAIQQ